MKNSLKLTDEKFDFVSVNACSIVYENILNAYRKSFFSDFESFLVTKQFDERDMNIFSKLHNDQFIDFEGTAGIF